MGSCCEVLARVTSTSGPSHTPHTDFTKSRSMKLPAVCVCLLLVVQYGYTLDLGRGGVYDSPAAQDYWVRRFGFMFGGGRSGMKGLRALQESMEKQGMMKPKKSPLRASSKAVYLTKEKKMVEMEPMMVHNSLDRSDRKGRMFYRFM